MDPKVLQRFLNGDLSMREVSGIDPDKFQQMAQDAYQWLTMGRLDNARVAYQGLIALEPRVPYLWVSLAAIDLAEGELRQARDRATYTLALNPREHAAFVIRGETMMRAGRLKEAADDFKQALALDRQNRLPLTRRARILAQSLVTQVKAAQQKKKAPPPKKPPAPSGKKG